MTQEARRKQPCVSTRRSATTECNKRDGEVQISRQEHNVQTVSSALLEFVLQHIRQRCVIAICSCSFRPSPVLSFAISRCVERDELAVMAAAAQVAGLGLEGGVFQQEKAADKRHEVVFGLGSDGHAVVQSQQ